MHRLFALKREASRGPEELAKVFEIWGAVVEYHAQIQGDSGKHD